MEIVFFLFVLLVLIDIWNILIDGQDAEKTDDITVTVTILGEAVLGTATSKSYTGVYADKGTTPLQAWPELGPGNRVVVYSKEGDWYRVQIAASM